MLKSIFLIYVYLISLLFTALYAKPLLVLNDFSKSKNVVIFNNPILDSIQTLIKRGETEKALTQLYAYIGSSEQAKDSISIIESTLFLSDVLRDNGNFKKSNIEFDKIIPLIALDTAKLQEVFFKKGGNFQNEGEIDSAMVNYQKAVFFSEAVENNHDLKAKIHANLSGIYYLKEDYNKAIEHSKIAAKNQEFIGNIDIQAGILNNLGSIYFMQGNYKEALKSFQQSLNKVGYGQTDLQKQTRRSAYINIAYAYSALNNFKQAFQYQDSYFSLSDSLQQELKYKEIAEIESKFNLERKEKEAEIEKSKRLKAEYLSYGLGFSIFILLFVIYALFKLYTLSKRNYKLQIGQEQLLHQSKIEKIKSESQAKILTAVMDGRLEERKTIASVLHDNVSALLSAANLHLFAAKGQLKHNAPKEIEKSQIIISQASDSIRDLSHNLMSSILLKFGLGMAVQDLCEKSLNNKITITSESKNIKRFNQAFEIKMFSIVSELVNNILKHSKAKNAVVKLEQLNGNLQIIVFDDGIGFDTHAIEPKNGIGLNQIEARISVMKGIIKINSQETGTRIFISVPIVY